MLLLLCSCLRAASAGQEQRLHDPLSNPGFVAFYNNDYEQAIAYFAEQVKAHPEDPAPYNHLAQSLLYQEMFRNGSLESQLVSGNNAFLRRDKMSVSPEVKARFNECINKSLALSNARLQADGRAPIAFYYQAGAHALRATYYFLVEKAWVDALKEASAARRASEAAISQDPQFVDARMIPGVYSYIVGNLPFYMRAVGLAGGFHGDKAGGIQQLQLVASQGTFDRYDADVLLAVLYRRERKAQLAIPLLEHLASKFPRNYLFRFEQVQMYSDLGNKRKAVEVLEQIDQLQRSAAPGYAKLPAAKVRFAAGNLHFWYNDFDQALADFRFVTEHAKELDLNGELIGWLRLGQVNDLLGHHAAAVSAYREVMKLAPGSEIGNEAKGYVQNPYRRKPKES